MSSISARGKTTLPYITADCPGIGGELKVRPEDFYVEEIPAYEPCGEGEFLFVTLEKRDLNTQDVVQRLAEHCGVGEWEISAAGLKDRFAVARQTVCLPARCAGELDSFFDDQIDILSTGLHRNKLKPGHLRGNSFSILVRNAVPDALARARGIRTAIEERGFPNYFGDQRFGVNGDNASAGFELLAGRHPFRKMSLGQRKFLTRLSLSAAQSELFNRCLRDRIRKKLFLKVQAGDVMQVVRTGGPFVVENVTAEQARFEARETAITGPIFGPKMRSPMGQPAVREESVLTEAGLTFSNFVRHSKLTLGTRRPYRVCVPELGIKEEPSGLRFEFELPKGVYATSLMREFLKSDRYLDVPE